MTGEHKLGLPLKFRVGSLNSRLYKRRFLSYVNTFFICTMIEEVILLPCISNAEKCRSSTISDWKPSLTHLHIYSALRIGRYREWTGSSLTSRIFGRTIRRSKLSLKNDTHRCISTRSDLRGPEETERNVFDKHTVKVVKTGRSGIEERSCYNSTKILGLPVVVNRYMNKRQEITSLQTNKLRKRKDHSLSLNGVFRREGGRGFRYLTHYINVSSTISNVKSCPGTFKIKS